MGPWVCEGDPSLSRSGDVRPLCCQAVHSGKPNYFETSRHTYRRQSRFRHLDSYLHWGIQWFYLPNPGMSGRRVQVGQGRGGCRCHNYSQDRDLVTVYILSSVQVVS